MEVTDRIFVHVHYRQYIHVGNFVYKLKKKRIEISFMADISRDKVSLLVKQRSYKLKIKVMQPYFLLKRTCFQNEK